MRFPGFIGPTYQLRSINVDCQRCINLFPEINELGTGKEHEIASLAPTPGLSLWQTVGLGPIRGMHVAANGNLFVVTKQTFYQVTSGMVVIPKGSLISTSGTVSITDDGFNLIIVDGPHGYDFNFSTDTFAQITDEHFLGSDRVAWQDGYFIFNVPNSQNWYISDLPSANPGDLITFAGDTASAEGSPDNIVAILSVHRNVWIFGEVSTEVWFNSGDAEFPFQEIQGSFVKYGLAAKFSAAAMGDIPYWLGKDERGAGVVVRAQGYQPQRISTYAIEQAIQQYETISDATAFTYQENGHHFYVLNFPTANKTWAFDETTSLWHERAYLNQGQLERHRANFHAFAYGLHLVGDYENANIYQMSTEIESDNGREIQRQRIAPHFSSGLNRIFHKCFQLDIEPGVGLDGLGQGTDPQVILQFSDDGGHTWSNEKWRSMGKIGQTRQRVKWNRLGQARDRVYKVTITDPVRTAIIGAELDVEAGTN